MWREVCRHEKDYVVRTAGKATVRMIGRRTKARLAKSFGSEQRNALSTLCANLGFASVDQPLRTIAITSAMANEGKTTIAIELARAMAASGKRTLLVECDMRRRSLAGRLGAHAQAGICSVVLGDVEPARAVVRTAVPLLHLLDAEPGVACPVDILDSQSFRSLIAHLGRRFDHVVVDTPPAGLFVDAAVIGSIVDATLLVVREGFAERAMVAKACDQLRKGGANLVGVVMSCCEEGASRYRAYEGVAER